MQELLNRMQTNINEIREQNLQPSEDVKNQWEQLKVGKTKVEMVTASWGQDRPFNGECPNINGQTYFTGCVATAYAILMKYYGSPSYGIGATEPYYTKTEGIYVPARDVNHLYDWSNMPLSYDKDYTPAQGKEVARLMADIGSAIQMDYCNIGAAGRIGLPGIVAHFNYASGNLLRRSDYTDQQWHSLLQKELDKRAPILYDGNTGGNGHAFILDGYTDDNYYHVNWGWSGQFNGYFLLDNLAPTAGRDYSDNSKALIGFKPLESVGASEAIAVVDGRLCPDFDSVLALAGYTHHAAKMLQNVNIGRCTISDAESISLDLNGKCLETEGIYNYGSLTITDADGNGQITTGLNNAVVNNYGTLTIESGGFSNTAETYVGQNDYRRVLWTGEGSNTVINGGTFTNVAGANCLCLNGKTVVEGGEFVHHGNSSVISNFCTAETVMINGGVFTNDAVTYAGENDYRRVLWTAEGSKTVINGGTFNCPNAPWNLLFNGTVTINKADVDTPKGTDCYVKGDCAVNYARMAGKTNINNKGHVVVYEGLFSRQVAASLVANGSSCAANSDAMSKAKYPYAVIRNENMGIGNVETDDMASPTYYNLAGQRINNARHGSIVITGNPNAGASRKQIVR